MKIGGNVVGGCSCRMRQVPMTSNVEIWIVICIGRLRNKNRSNKSPKLQVELDGHENWWEFRRGTDLSDATGADDKQRRNLDCHMYRSNKEQKYAKKSPKLQVELDGHENWWECRRGL